MTEKEKKVQPHSNREFHSDGPQERKGKEKIINTDIYTGGKKVTLQKPQPLLKENS